MGKIPNNSNSKMWRSKDQNHEVGITYPALVGRRNQEIAPSLLFLVVLTKAEASNSTKDFIFLLPNRHLEIMSSYGASWIAILHENKVLSVKEKPNEIEKKKAITYG